MHMYYKIKIMDFLEICDCNHTSKNTNVKNKQQYGEVKTDFSLINKYFLDMIPEELFLNENLKWLDPGSGTGNFSICIFKRLMFSLKDKIPDIKKRKKHIITNMLFMVEINIENIEILKNIFGENANIYHHDYLTWDGSGNRFDIIIGNPPFNNDGFKKVPTNLKISKLNDGNTIWTSFVKHSFQLLEKKGYLSMIVPAIWLKPDKAKIYDLLTKYKIHKLKSFTNTQTNQLFHGQAQTPSSIFLLQNIPTDNKLFIYDENDKIHNYYLKKDSPIPIIGISVINKLQKYVDDVGYINIIKTNLPAKHIEIYDKKKSDLNLTNITTCILEKSNPKLVFNYSYVPCPYYNKPKLVLAHGMYGFPFLDAKGEYGISNRDKYVIIDRSIEDLQKFKHFLSTKLAIYIFESTKYRMKYLEKYAFELLPDITKIKDFPEVIDDNSINSFFNLTEDEIEDINSLHKKSYGIL